MDALVIALTVLLFLAIAVIFRYRDMYARERSSKASLATKHGLTFEQLAPFSKDFPGNPRAFRFIGDPVDGVLFGDDEITFVEFKTGSARTNDRQSRIKKIVEDGRVAWKEIKR
ncbi:MAG: endonuclease [Candidatus Aenigmatarchaeota archaeon]|nr:MAG: endonuclease [Candidatus Aenigmarchaeota archaeon]